MQELAAMTLMPVDCDVPLRPLSGADAGYASPDPLAAIGVEDGDLIGETYRIVRTLGVGGMGVVVLAQDERLDRHVAIKLVRPQLAHSELRALFHDEARAMARVSHRNVLSIFAFGDHDQKPYFVMEHVDGYTAEDWLGRQKEGAPNIDEAVQILDQACLGVAAIHATGIVHRDLKPSNLLIDKSFRVAVGDLGLARILGTSPASEIAAGSSTYLAPEAAFGEEVDPALANRRDIYALGCIAYELLTGRPPFVGDTDAHVLSQHVIQEPLPPSERRKGLPRGFDDVVLRALEKDPKARYATAEAFRAALLAQYAGTREPERILLADDDAEWGEILSTALATRFPHAVIEHVTDGAAARAAFQARPYSAVLVDLEMPELDGAALTEFLRSLESARHTPIVVLTAAGGPSEWKRLSAIGADAFLVKPVVADDVELVIRRALRSRVDQLT